jgi:hypothetical protein
MNGMKRVAGIVGAGLGLLVVACGGAGPDGSGGAAGGGAAGQPSGAPAASATGKGDILFQFVDSTGKLFGSKAAAPKTMTAQAMPIHPPLHPMTGGTLQGTSATYYAQLTCAADPASTGVSFNTGVFAVDAASGVASGGVNDVAVGAYTGCTGSITDSLANTVAQVGTSSFSVTDQTRTTVSGYAIGNLSGGNALFDLTGANCFDPKNPPSYAFDAFTVTMDPALMALTPTFLSGAASAVSGAQTESVSLTRSGGTFTGTPATSLSGADTIATTIRFTIPNVTGPGASGEFTCSDQFANTY